MVVDALARKILIDEKRTQMEDYCMVVTLNIFRAVQVSGDEDVNVVDDATIEALEKNWLARCVMEGTAEGEASGHDYDEILIERGSKS